MLATASGDKTVRIWDARLSKAVANIATKVTTTKAKLCFAIMKFELQDKKCINIR